MTGSFNKIDYRLRPAKHAERVMLADLFKRIGFGPIESYQYVGMGSVGFVDFRLFYRALGLSPMISIEAPENESDKERFEKNVPFACVDLRFGWSSAVLPTVDFKKQSIVWLDYDDPLNPSMALDLEIIAQDIPSGSFVGVTFGRQFPSGGELRDTLFTQLKTGFKDLVPVDAKAAIFDGPKLAEFGRRALGERLRKALSDADANNSPEAQRTAQQVCYFKYKDGNPMVTIGWIIYSASDKSRFDASRLSDLSFYRAEDDAFEITVPLVTPIEVREMERRLPDLLTATDLDWIPQKHREAFAKSARYLPHFATLEGV